ncbi:MAG: hypothetical protein ABEI31_09100, partial [Halodesulfurarchaeum sp.]
SWRSMSPRSLQQPAEGFQLVAVSDPAFPPADGRGLSTLAGSRLVSLLQKAKSVQQMAIPSTAVSKASQEQEAH